LKSVAEIGHLIRAERKAQGLRQNDLAAASGVGLRFIVDLERGKETVQLGKVLVVLATLGCSLQLSRPGEGQGACVYGPEWLVDAAAPPPPLI